MLNFARCSLLALALASFGCVSGTSPEGSSAGASAIGNPNGGAQQTAGGGAFGSAGVGVGPGPGAGAGGTTSTSTGGTGVGGGSSPGGGASGAFSTGDDSPPAIVVDPNDVVSSAPLSMLKPAFMSATHSLKPHAVFGGHAAPLPTDAFWENMVLDSGDFLTNAFPYHVNAQAAGVALSRPEMLTTSNTFCYESAPVAVVLGASEAFTGHTVASWDPLSVTLKYAAASGSMSAPIVYGMAYGTGLYDGLTPKISLPVGLGSVNGMAAGSAQGARFDLALNNGQKWILYASESVSVTWTANAVTFAAPLKGWVRAALQTTAVTAAVLDQHANAIPTGGALRLSATGDTGVVEFSWTKLGTGDILAFALPHHLDHLAKPNLVTAGFTSVRGQIRGVSGDLWQLQYPLSPALRAAPTPVDPTRKDAIVAALNGEKGAQPSAGDSYDFGKQVGRAAELLLIAEALGETASAGQLRTSIESALGQWLDGAGPDPLRYDETYGGVVTSQGLGGAGNDYGNGWYNDHHFHYGYFIYAAGAVAKGDPTWAAKYKEPILALIRDIANPSAADPFFTQYRMFDWFDGHGWASGLFPFQDGRDQESSSESFNAWAGIALYGDAIGDKNLLNLGRIMRATEAASVQRYYHIRKNSDIYPAPYNAKATTGVLWSDKAEFATFFSGGDAQIIGIQLLPFTIASEELIDAAWVTDAWPAMQAAGGGDSWGGLMNMAHATVDKASAWTALTAMGGVEGGNSKTNTLYWVATRP
jgi:endo-1,3(4)-beta-glucanase